MRPRNPTHQPHDRYGCCICNDKHCCCQCSTEVRPSDSDPVTTITHQFFNDESLIRVYSDGSATIQHRVHEGAGWGPPRLLSREEV
jgi:hypothetical protein